MTSPAVASHYPPRRVTVFGEDAAIIGMDNHHICYNSDISYNRDVSAPGPGPDLPSDDQDTDRKER